jgi:glyoxylase-like metal-dependent hydrolase (beta-lactamase superfamily II)
MGSVRRSGLTVIAALAGLQAVHAQDYDNARIETQEVGDGLYVLYGLGEDVIARNIRASNGDQGELLVDDQFPEIAPKYKAAIANLGGGNIDIVINTHWHFDHADGNKALGPEGARIVAHETSRRMMMQDNVINLVAQEIQQPAFPAAALPVMTYDTVMHTYFNGERIDLMHFGPAHTEGDTAVILRDSQVVHLGDVFNMSGYPFIDADNGGSLSGVIDFCQAVLDQLEPTAIVVPGHGPVSDYQGLADYIARLSTIRDRMQTLIDSGASLEQVVAARPTAEFDARQGDPSGLLNRAYASMTR